jgi:hypothetical protein
MMNDPIVVWPPGTMAIDCSQFGENAVQCDGPWGPNGEWFYGCCYAW